MKYVASMKMEHCASASGLDKLLLSLEQYLQEHPPVTDNTFSHMIDTAQALHNEKLLEQCCVAKARCQETYHLLLLRQNTLQRAKDQLLLEHGHEHVKNTSSASLLLDQSRNCLQNLSEIQEKESNSDILDKICVTDNDTKPVGDFTTPTHLPKKENLREDCFTVWEPRTTSTPAQEGGIGWSDSYGLCHSRHSSSRSRKSGVKSCTDFSLSSDNRLHVSQDKNSTVIVDPTAKKVDPASIMKYHDFQNRSSGPPGSGDFKIPSNGAARLVLSRTISQPITLPNSSIDLLSPSTSVPSVHRPLKKMLKRASTAPVPMIISPVIQENQELDSTAGKQLLEPHMNKTLSMMTGSSDSLPRSVSKYLC